ncbi:hypothetical protein Tco_0253614, partial [Tanacetum coccineum]
SSKEVDREPETITDQVLTGSTNNVSPLVIQPSPASTYSPPISSPMMPEPNPHQPSIPYPSRLNKEKLQALPRLLLTCLNSLTPFGDSDFILEEIDTFLASNDSISPDIDDGIFDMEGDIRLIETLLNKDILNDLPPSLPVSAINEKIKSSIKDPPDLEIKDLPSHLEYAFLEGTSKLPVIIVKDLKREEKEQLLKVLKS